MRDKEFNLLVEPWIKALDEECRIHEVSLIELFRNAHKYKDLCGELPTQDFAIMRLLLAVLHTVFSRYDVDGSRAELDDPDDALDRWEELWKNKKFPDMVIANYLESQEENFYLFHPERPFYQANFAINATTYDAAKLNGIVSQSGNTNRMFTMINGMEKDALFFSEAARWIININSFDDSAVKAAACSKKAAKEREEKLDSPGVGWLGKLGLITVCGNNLFQTLMLNLILLNENGELYGAEKPIWEQKDMIEAERIEIPQPDNLSELYTLPSRLLLLQRNMDRVTEYKVLSGKFFEEENAFIEPMTLWKKDAKKEIYRPQTHDSSKQFWREFASVCPISDKAHCPGIISWIRRLVDEEIIGNMPVHFKIVSVQYDKKKCKITNVFSDSMQMYASLISDMNMEMQQAVLDSIEFCDDISKKVWTLAKNINLAAGGSSSTKESKGTSEEFAKNVKAEFYNRIDMPFRKWLRGLNPETDDSYEKQKIWRHECVGIARKLGNEIVRQAGTAAIFGRTKVFDDKKKKKSETFSAADAMNKFLSGLSMKEME